MSESYSWIRLSYTRTLESQYLTVYHGNSLSVYTNKSNGELIRFEIFENFAPFIADTKLKKLLREGDLELLRLMFGPEDRSVINADENATEYIYDRRGIAFVKYAIGDRTISALRFEKIAAQ